MIEAGTVEQFCAIVSNQGEAFKMAHTKHVKAPMDFVIVTGWQAGCFLHFDGIQLTLMMHW